MQSQQDTIHSIYSADTLEEWATASLPPCTYYENAGVQVGGFVNGTLTLTNMLQILSEYNNAILLVGHILKSDILLSTTYLSKERYPKTKGFFWN